jgi:hypothetical protein
VVGDISQRKRGLSKVGKLELFRQMLVCRVHGGCVGVRDGKNLQNRKE